MSETETKASPFWRFSLAFYRQQNVADACIALQEQSGVDVNILFFLLWNATHNRALSNAEVADLERNMGAWRAMAVAPLRNVRRALKSPPQAVAPQEAEGFRTRIKAVELEAERLQQEAMYELASAAPLGMESPSSAEAARVNVAAYETMGAVPFPKPAVETLLAAFAKLDPKGE